MPRSRGSEMPQRQSTRGPLQLRTSSSESDPLHHRPTVDRSPKLGDRRSPRGSQSDPLHQKKLGTRVADLESQLGHAQEELKKLKEQLASAEAAKNEVQQELEKKIQKPAVTPDTEEEYPPPAPPLLPPTTEIQETNDNKNSNSPDESLEENSRETDVFEVPVVEVSDMTEQENETKSIEKCTEPPLSEAEKTSLDDLAMLNEEINLLKAQLDEREKEVEVLRVENENLDRQVTEGAAEIASARVREEEITLKMNQMGDEIEKSKENAASLRQQLEAVEEAKAELESEMKKLRVQTEQWRKAADAAAAVLAGGMEMNGRKMNERCGSMDKHVVSGGAFAGGYTGFVGSPTLADELDDGFGSGKRKGSGIRMFGDLWKKKGLK